MLELDIQTNIEKLMKKMRKSFDELEFTVPMKRSGVYMLGQTDRNFTEQHTPDGVPWKPIKSITKFSRKKRGGAKALMDTGLLKNSITFKLEGKFKMVITSIRKAGNVDLASIHQHGATIKPVSKQFLTIPIHKLARVKTAAQYKATGNTYVAKSKKGTLFIMLRQKGGKSIPLFILKKRIEIPKREFLGFSQKNTEFIEKIFADWVLEELKKKWK